MQYHFRTRDQDRARAQMRDAIGAWILLIVAGLTLGAMFALAM